VVNVRKRACFIPPSKRGFVVAPGGIFIVWPVRRLSAPSFVVFFRCGGGCCSCTYFAADYKAVEYLRHGPDIIYFDNNGRILPRPPLSVRDWTGLIVLIVVQVFVIFALYRSYRRKPKICPQ
jgi:hypothetical protein